ncbi:carbohydrate ABC transporter permease [Streptomyces sp. NPDC092370]|uniref:carbohydrate ABC transporter permease n=1 Tax=Streptomyces sp. NPDC092370 TaxID=3366016 RepID=UPI00381DA251
MSSHPSPTTTLNVALHAAPLTSDAPRKQRAPIRPARILLHTFLVVTALAWLAPLLWALLAAMRPYAETSTKGYVSWPDKLTFDNFTDAFQQSEMLHYFGNTLLIAVPAVLLTLLLSSMVAFYVSRFDFRLNLFLLLVFTAGNLLPQQVIITPLYRLYLLIDLPGITMSGKLYDSALGLVLIHVAFQAGFCAFVLSNYMRSLPHELTEAALVDGASVWRLYWQIVLPLCKPAMAALATLLSIWIYNDFFWAIVLISTGENMPITSALNNLSGQYFTDPNLVAAGALLTAIPTLIVYFALQRQFVSGLTLGANKG